MPSALVLFSLLATRAIAGTFDYYSGVGPTLGGQASILNIIQSISAERAFMKDDPDDDNIFMRKRRESEPPNKWEPPEEPTNVSWNLGYTLAYTMVGETANRAASNDHVHSLSGGLGWDPLEEFGVNLGVRGDSNPRQGYRAGTITLGFGTVYYLDPPKRRQADDEDIDEEDIAPHLRHAEGFLAKGDISFRKPKKSEGLREDDVIEDPGPVIFGRLNMLFGRHIKFASTGRTAGGALISFPAQDLRQYGVSLEGWYYPEPITGYRLNLTVWRYNADIDTFLQSFRTLASANPLAARSAGLGSFASVVMGFPSVSVDAGVVKTFLDIWSAEWGLNLTTYEAELAKATYGGSGGLYRAFGDNWRAGVGVDLTLGSGFTTVMGSLLLSRSL